MTEKKGPGRPSKYKEEYAEQAKKLAEHGFTDEEMADFFKVCVSTLYLWKTKHIQFSDAIKIGGSPCDDRVERSLYQRATGYIIKSEKVFNASGTVLRAETFEHIPPDTGAAIFWLKNRRKEQWRDKTETGFTDPEGKPMSPILNVSVTRDQS
jgi:hypothetical protein